MLLLKEILNVNGAVKATLKKISRCVPTNERKYLNLNKSTLESIDACIQSYYKLSKLLRELCQNVSMLNIFSTNDSISTQKLEELLYQVYDKVYLNDDAGPLDSMR